MISDTRLDELLKRLSEEGKSHDAAEPDPARKLRNITPSTGRFLELLIQEEHPRRILEIGTSNGYSTLWILRAAAATGISVETVDHSQAKHDLATANLAAAEALDLVTLHTTDAGSFLQNSPDQYWDFVFLDSNRSRYSEWWPNLLRCFGSGVVVVDNAVTHTPELQPLLSLIDADPQLERTILTIGNGLLLVRRRPSAEPALVTLGLGSH
ncbi:MAG: hypothetical protein RL215_3363 [Planctomycetota bacterium]|jgi:predicted O-methyltransferase YrrM